MTPLSMHETQHLLATEPAWLMAIGARLWVTRQGDADDHVLAPGERLPVACGDRLVVGPWSPGDGAGWVWQSRGSAAGHVSVYGWRRLPAALRGAAARVLRGAAAGLAALARRAAAMASRAQGCMRPGESIASAGTVQ